MVSQITAEELAERVDEDSESFTLVDTRQEDSFEGWHVRGAENVPFDPTEGFEDDHREAVEAAADGDPVVVVCGKGLTSTPFGIHLEDDGYERDGKGENVTVVEGGMEAWSTVHETVDVAGEDDLLVRQLQRRGTGCLGYVVGDRSAGEAVVVDPTRQTDEFAVAAETAGLTISTVVDTHVHADHLSGGPDLADELGVPYFLGIDLEEPEVEHGYDSLEDGETLAAGDVELRAIHAPGHTKEMANFAVDDRYLLSADTLHVDSVGRTELGFGEDRADEGAALLYETLRERLLALDDDTTVLPGHVSIAEDNRYEAGSAGKPIRERLGDLREERDLLGLDREAFVAELTDDLPEKPDEYETVIAVNAGSESVDTEAEAAELETGPNNCSA